MRVSTGPSQVLILSGILVAGCGDYPKDGTLRMNHVQAKGTHNSYHLEPPTVVHPSHRYSHAPLDVQLEAQGVRQFELDLHRRVDGVFEVFHLPGEIDQRSSCNKLTDCLQVAKRWSDEHPDHVPLIFWLEPKDLELDWADERYQLFVGAHAEIEADILSVWPRDRIITPDSVRKAHPSLPEAIRTDGWPTLEETRGKALFAMLDRDEHRTAYVGDTTALAKKLMFVASSTPSDDYAAMFKIDDAMREAQRVRALVQAGFIVTSNVDSVERSDADNQAKVDVTLAAGSHFSSSDLPAPVDGRAYSLELPGAHPVRCNPVSAPVDCTSADLELPRSDD